MDLAVARRLVAGVVIGLIVPQLANSQTTTPQKQPLNTISGKVTIKGKAAAGAVVSLRRSDMNNPYEMLPRTLTDVEGNYRITNVGIGNYEVIAMLPAYVVTEPASVSNRRVVVAEGETVENLDFSLVRGGVITGKITDADGKPAIQQQVFLYRANSWEQRNPQARQPIFPATTAQTDDRGIYRMFGLAPGSYKVAIGQGEDSYSGPLTPTRALYKQVFYPDATDQSKATIIEVSEGSEATNIDIALGRPAQTFSASGKAIDGSGLPVFNLRFTVYRMSRDNNSFLTTLVTTNRAGEFLIDNLPSGKYGYSLMSERDNDLKLETTSFEIEDQDVAGLILKLIKGESISGVVVLEPENPKAAAKLAQSQLQIYVSPAEGSSPVMGRQGTSSIASDGSFRVGGLSAGTVNFFLADAQTRGRLKSFVIARVERDGVIIQRPLEIKEGENLSGVRVIVRHGDTTLRGRINVENGPLPAGSQFNLRLSRPGENSFSPFAMVDARGSFVVENLTPGIVEIVVSLVMPDRKPRKQVKQQISLQEGIVNTVVITYDLSEPKAP